MEKKIRKHYLTSFEKVNVKWKDNVLGNRFKETSKEITFKFTALFKHTITFALLNSNDLILVTSHFEC
jgi:hypothetical protein